MRTGLLHSQQLEATPKQEKQATNFCKLLCTVSILTFIVSIICIAYFDGNSPLNAASPAKNLAQNEEIAPMEVEDLIETSVYYNSKGSDDLIHSMPNLLESTCASSPTNCKFKQYSGYLLANDNREIHYWFIESETTPHKKPVFIWTNGGPGCSGMDGLLTEHGPWKAMKDGYIAYNEYSWINEVNIVYLEQPFGVGFSTVSDDETVIVGDQNAADDMDAAIRDFIHKFPLFADNIFYLSSESWGGHYVPITTYTILQNNDKGITPHINFGGFLLGNPSTDPYENAYGFVGGIHGHGMLRSMDWTYWRANCWDNAENMDSMTECAAITSRAYYNAKTANFYALDYVQCVDDDDVYSTQRIKKNAHIHHTAKKSMKKVLDSAHYDELNMGHITKEDLLQLYNEMDDKWSVKMDTKSAKDQVDALTKQKVVLNMDHLDADGKAASYDACIAQYMSTYLNLDIVQKVLHVKPTTWSLCSMDVYSQWPETDHESFMQQYYTDIVNDYVDALDLTLSIYSGDDDSVCGLQGTMYWLERWQFDVNEENEWKQWKDDDEQLGGYYTQYMQSNGNVALHFITVRSAGHMVPTTQPKRALTLLRKYLHHFVITK